MSRRAAVPATETLRFAGPAAHHDHGANHQVVRFKNSVRVWQLFTLPRFAGGSSLSEGRALPGEAPTLPLARLAGGEGEAYPCSILKGCLVFV